MLDRLPKPFAHQVRAHDGIASEWRAGARNILVVMPTGAGKTLTAVAAIARALQRGRRATWLAHREELTDQATAALEQLVPNGVGTIRAGRSSEPSRPIQVASVQTILRRGDIPPTDVLILDEAHHYVADEWQPIVEAFGSSVELRLGFTATPQRGDGRPMGREHGGIFDALVVPTTVAELQRTLRPDGWPVLCRSEVFAPPRAQTGMWCDPIEAMHRFGRRTDGWIRPAIVFCGTRAESTKLAERLNASGWRAEAVDDRMSSAARRSAVQRYAAGELDVLTNVYILTEGFDAVRTEVVMCTSGVTVEGAWLQRIGRGLRASPATRKQVCTVVDLRGNVWKHGLAEQDRTYTLNGSAITRSGSEAPLSQCRSCGAIVMGPRCERCGMPVGVVRRPRPPKVERAEGQLVTGEAIVASTERQTVALVGMLRKAHAAKAAGRGWKPNAIGMAFKGMFGRWPSQALIDAATKRMNGG